MQEKAELNAMLNELAFQVERQDTQIRELSRVIADLGEFFSLSRQFSLTISLSQIYFRFPKLDSKNPERFSERQKTVTRA
jgi:hypothetical protein